jgi:two-component system, cell cycle response regulator
MISSSDILQGKVLIVDDQETNVLLLEEILRGAGYVSVTSTTDPADVCPLYRTNRYDLILLDLMMPGTDGFQVMSDLKEIEIEGYLPVLAVTAHHAHKLRALQCGAKDFISKPFELDEVLMRVRNMLEVRLLHEAARSQARMLEFLALKDPLTGLANRRLLAERMAMGLVHARRNNTIVALVYLDLDGFKQVNNTLGHGAGDTLLKLVAGRLLDTVREEDTVARVGGDEFVIALWHIGDADDAGNVASKVIDALSEPFELDGRRVTLTASAGIGVYPVHGEDADTLMKSADLALYVAKRAGKNGYRISERTDLSVVVPPQYDPSALRPPRSSGSDPRRTRSKADSLRHRRRASKGQTLL